MKMSNLELFKKALFEAMSSKTSEENLTEKIEPSDQHKSAMQAIINSTYEQSRVWKITKGKIAAIIVAAALLLVGCYKGEIKDFIEDIYDKYIKVTYYDEDTNGKSIEEIYELTYVPEGYVLEESNVSPLFVRYIFANSNGDRIIFEQVILGSNSSAFDNENGEYTIIIVKNMSVYYKSTTSSHYYFWNDGKYFYQLNSDISMPPEELQQIFDNIEIK